MGQVIYLRPKLTPRADVWPTLYPASYFKPMTLYCGACGFRGEVEWWYDGEAEPEPLCDCPVKAYFFA